MKLINQVVGIIYSQSELKIIQLLTYAMIGSAFVTLFSMLKFGIRASYGRYSSESIFFKVFILKTFQTLRHWFFFKFILHFFTNFKRYLKVFKLVFKYLKLSFNKGFYDVFLKFDLTANVTIR